MPKVSKAIMHDFLTQHLASLCAFYKIKRWEDLERIQFGTSPDQLKKLEQALVAERLFKAIKQGYWPGVNPTATVFELWPKDEKLAVIEIIVSRIAPLFYSEVRQKEAFEPLDFTLPTAKHVMESEAYQKYLVSLKKPISPATKRLHDKTLPIIAANGFIHVSEKLLDRHPLEKGIPRFLRTRSFNFFYFHSTGYFP